jgi:hypothetical protein
VPHCYIIHTLPDLLAKYRGADNSLARPGRKQAWKHVRDARDFNNIEARAVVKFSFCVSVHRSISQIKTNLMQHCAGFISEESLYMFRA